MCGPEHAALKEDGKKGGRVVPPYTLSIQRHAAPWPPPTCPRVPGPRPHAAACGCTLRRRGVLQSAAGGGGGRGRSVKGTARRARRWGTCMGTYQVCRQQGRGGFWSLHTTISYTTPHGTLLPCPLSSSACHEHTPLTTKHCWAAAPGGWGPAYVPRPKHLGRIWAAFLA